MPGAGNPESKHLKELAELWMGAANANPRPEDAAFGLALGAALKAAGAPGQSDRVFAAVLSLEPGNQTALRARAAHLARSNPEAAVGLVAEGLKTHPDDPELLWSLAQAEAALGEDAEESLLRAASAVSGPKRAERLVELADARSAKGKHAAAEADLREALGLAPDRDSTKIVLKLGRALRVQGKSGEAEMLCRDALSKKPEAVALWQLLIDLHLARDAHAEAAELGRTALATAAGDLTLVQLQTARAYQALQDWPSAEALYQNVAERKPDHPKLLQGQIEVALAQGKIDAAVRTGERAVARWPDDAALALNFGRALRGAGETARASTLFQSLVERFPKHVPLRLECAALLRAEGGTERAGELYAAGLALSPENFALRNGYIQLSEATGDTERALALCWASEPAPSFSQPPDTNRLQPPVAWAAAVRLLIKMNRRDWAEHVLNLSAAAAQDLPVDDHAQLARNAEFLGVYEAAEPLLLGLLERERLSVTAAMAVMERAHATQDAALSDATKDFLLTKLPTELAQTQFKARQAELCVGPDEAVAAMRAFKTGERQKYQALLLGRLLLNAGQTKLGYRYLRHCVRRWGDELGLRERLVDAALNIGRPDLAEQHLEEAKTAFSALDLQNAEARLLTRLGRLDAARALLMPHWEAGTLKAPLQTLLFVVLAQGDLESAMPIAEAYRKEPRKNRSVAYHFNLTHPGSLLNELRILDLQKAYEPDGPDPQLAEGFFIRASQVLTAHETALMTTKPADSQVPKRIFQYWDASEPPAEVKKLMAEWAAAPGFSYELFDRQTARKWLQDTLGPEALRAFKLANHVAEESDFIRLCKLYVDGGIYMDSDNRFIGSADDLLRPDATLFMYRDPYGAIPNDVIVAKPGHPIIERAMRLAQASLLAREGELTWMKTGPGLMTRAVAAHLVDTPSAAETDLTLRPLYESWTVINPCMKLPYKNTSAYWNDQTGEIAPRIKAALEAATKPVATA